MFLSLMYHNVVADGFFTSPRGGYARLSPSITSYFVEEAEFRRHVAWLADHAEVISLSKVRRDFARRDTSGAVGVQASACNRDVGSSPTPRVQITFDDGWKESLDRAGPILAAAGMPALVFVTTDLIGKPLFATKTDLQQLPADYRLGSHARTHDFLNEMEESAIREELLTSKKVLEDLTGREVDAISIPNGAIDARVRRLAVEVGYRLIHTSDVHVNTPQTGPLNIGRIAIRNTTTVANLESAVTGTGLAGQSFRRQLLDIPKTLLGPRRYRRLRGWILGEELGQLEMTDLSGA